MYQTIHPVTGLLFEYNYYILNLDNQQDFICMVSQGELMRPTSLSFATLQTEAKAKILQEAQYSKSRFC